MAAKATIVADCNPGEDVVVMALNAQGYHGVERKRLPVGDYQISFGDSVVWASSPNVHTLAGKRGPVMCRLPARYRN